MPKQTSPVQKPLSHSDVPSSVSSVKTQSAKEKKLCKVKKLSLFLVPYLFFFTLHFYYSQTSSYLSSGIWLQIDSPAVKQNEIKSGRRFSPLVFYGSPHGVPPKRPTRLLRLLYEIRRDLSEPNTLRYNA